MFYKNSNLKFNKLPVIALFLLLFCSAAFAQGSDEFAKQEEADAIKEQARTYREEGVRAQDIGDLDAAMKLYQKAVELDPGYSVAYNDLGVIYESKGMDERALESYLKALKIDPYYLSAYTNLALYYEGKRQFNKAAYCWNKRVELGDLNDPWTQMARQRLEDIKLVFSPNPVKDSAEKEVVNLMKDVANEKHALGQDDKLKASKHLKNAKVSYEKEDFATAVKEALDAQYLDPENKDIEEFILRTQRRALSR